MNNIENNPFASVGSAVQGTSFVGRENELRNISERLFGAEFGNVAIVGIPKIGKSSLMQEALMSKCEELWENNRYIIVWHTLKKPVNTDKYERRTVFLRLVSDVYHFLKKHEENDLLEDINEYYNIIKESDVVWSEFEQNILYFFEEIVYSKIRVIYCIDEFDYSKDLLGESEYLHIPEQTRSVFRGCSQQSEGLKQALFDILSSIKGRKNG